jgi:hypothetical protein
MGDTITFRRNLHLDILPDGKFAPTYCSEQVSDDVHSFHADSDHRPPTDLDLLTSYPMDFIGYIGAWVSGWMKMLWAKNYGTAHQNQPPV